MTEKIVNAELALRNCVLAMREALQCTVEDALPQSMLEGAEEEDGNQPDSLLQQLEQEHHMEQRRIRGLSEAVRKSFEGLRGAVVSLGGGVDPDGRIVDLPLEVLEKEIEMLSQQNGYWGAEMVKRYSEAEEIEAKLVEETMKMEVRPM